MIGKAQNIFSGEFFFKNHVDGFLDLKKKNELKRNRRTYMTASQNRGHVCLYDKKCVQLEKGQADEKNEIPASSVPTTCFQSIFDSFMTPRLISLVRF